MQLFDGEPQSTTSLNNKITYFEYNLDADSNFTVVVSPATGDPDIVVSVTDPNPTSSSYQWKAERWGFDVIQVGQNDPNYRANAKYYIGVYGFPDTSFTIAATKLLSYTILPEGTPLVQTVQAKAYRYFKFSLNRNTFDLVFTVTPLSSFADPDIFITYERERPSSSVYDYRAAMLGADTVTIPTAPAGM